MCYVAFLCLLGSTEITHHGTANLIILPIILLGGNLPSALSMTATRPGSGPSKVTDSEWVVVSESSLTAVLIPIRQFAFLDLAQGHSCSGANLGSLPEFSRSL